MIRSRRLMGPGPSDVSADTLAALAQPTVGHLDPQFCQMMDEIKSLQRFAFQTDTPHSYTLSAPGSAAMEAALSNVVEHGDKVLICINGVFGTRLAEMARRLGADVETLDFPWGEAVEPEAVRNSLQKRPAKLVAFVHAETSTGIRSDAETLCRIIGEAGSLSLVDCVTSVGGIELAMQDWGMDIVYAGSQKCLSCVPGIAPLMLSERAWESVEARRSPPHTWFSDLKLLAGYWSGEGKRAYHHTAPVNAMYAWHHVLSVLKREGLDRAWQRHAMHSRAMKAGLAALDLKLRNPEPIALPQLTVVTVPDGVDEAQVRQRLLDQHDLEIGAGLGAFAGSVWRIGLMGHGARRENVEGLITALAQELQRESAGKDALSAIAQCYSSLEAAA